MEPRSSFSPHHLDISDCGMSGGVSTGELETLFQEAFAPSVLYVDDMSDGCGAKFALIIVSEKFDGVGLLDRQRKVNELLKPFMARIHAVTMKCLTATQWESRKDTLLAERPVSS